MDERLPDRYWIERMADHQLKYIIEKGWNADIARDVWEKRWGMGYPLYKSCSGIKNAERDGC
jgi:hypothetical protein